MFWFSVVKCELLTIVPIVCLVVQDIWLLKREWQSVQCMWMHNLVAVCKCRALVTCMRGFTGGHAVFNAATKSGCSVTGWISIWIYHDGILLCTSSHKSLTLFSVISHISNVWKHKILWLVQKRLGKKTCGSTCQDNLSLCGRFCFTFVKSLNNSKNA